MSSWQMLILNLYFTIINCHAEVTYPSNLEKCQKSHLKSTVFISALWSVELYTVFYFPEGIAGNKTKADLWHWWNRRTLPGVRGLPEDTPQPRPCWVQGMGPVISQHNIYRAAALVRVGVISVNTTQYYHHYHYYYYFLILPPEWEKYWFHHLCDYS